MFVQFFIVDLHVSLTNSIILSLPKALCNRIYSWPENIIEKNLNHLFKNYTLWYSRMLKEYAWFSFTYNMGLYFPWVTSGNVTSNSSSLTLHKKWSFPKYFFCEWDQICRKLRIWSHLLTISLMENFIFCVVLIFVKYYKNFSIIPYNHPCFYLWCVARFGTMCTN